METKKPINAFVRQAVDVARNSTTIKGDASYCLPHWIKTFSDAFDNVEGVVLSANAAAALYHTLLCAKLRTERLVKERDESGNRT